MVRRSAGNAAVEFALAFPIVLSFFIPAVQILRTAFAQLCLEANAAQVARRVAADLPPGDDPAPMARALTAAVVPPITCRALVRRLVALPTAALRRPRTVDILEVDLTAAGPRIAGVPAVLHAHAREFLWGTP